MQKSGNISVSGERFFPKLAELLYRRFRSCRSVDALQEFLDVTGRDKQEKVIAVEFEMILESDTFREPDVEFLVSIGKS